MRLLLLLSFLPLLGACSNLGTAVGSAAQAYWNSRHPPGFEGAQLQPQLTYLEVVVPGNSALMVLAEVDQLKPGDRAVETWASAKGEVMRTQGGFFVGSAGVDSLPDNTPVAWGVNGQPVSGDFNMVSQGVSNLKMKWQSSNVPRQFFEKPTALFLRAQKIPDLNVQAWVANSPSTAPRTKAYREARQVVATHPTTGALVYGQYCPGTDFCLEYLLRTAAQNL